MKPMKRRMESASRCRQTEIDGERKTASESGPPVAQPESPAKRRVGPLTDKDEMLDIWLVHEQVPGHR